MASESDSGFSATPSAASPAINSRAATDSPNALINVDPALNPEDSEAGPDINSDAFTNEIFRDPSSFDFLSQHGSGNEAALALARQSLYVKFDPLIQGRPSIMPQIKDEEEDNNNDLIAMNSPSSRSQPQNRTKTKIEVEDDLAIAEQRAAFEEKMAKKESQGQELDKMSKNLSDELRLLQSEVRIKRESEEQMKQVLKEYEKNHIGTYC